MSRHFLDTNVLVYADDLDAGPKADVARGLLKEAFASHQGVLSTQVLQEFFSVATRKLGVPADVARRKVELLSKLEVVTVDVSMILGAIDLHRLHGLSFWDSLVLETASVGGCEVLFTEDMPTGQIIDGVRIENPFATS